MNEFEKAVNDEFDAYCGGKGCELGDPGCDECKAEWFKQKLIEAKETEEKSFQILHLYGIPRERAKSIPNGIGVLANRYDKEVKDMRRIVDIHQKNSLMLPASYDMPVKLRVMFAHTIKDDTFFGAVTIRADRHIQYEDDIDSIQKTVEAQFPQLKEVIIITWTELKG